MIRVSYMLPTYILNHNKKMSKGSSSKWDKSSNVNSFIKAVGPKERLLSNIRILKLQEQPLNNLTVLNLKEES